MLLKTSMGGAGSWGFRVTRRHPMGLFPLMFLRVFVQPTPAAGLACRVSHPKDTRDILSRVGDRPFATILHAQILFFNLYLGF